MTVSYLVTDDNLSCSAGSVWRTIMLENKRNSGYSFNIFNLGWERKIEKENKKSGIENHVEDCF